MFSAQVNLLSLIAVHAKSQTDLNDAFENKNKNKMAVPRGTPQK